MTATASTSPDVERLIEATRGSRNEARDRCLLLLMFRHGLRVSEACRMKLDQVDTQSRVLHVSRLKGELSTTQPLRGDELRAVRRARMKPAGKTIKSHLSRLESGRLSPSFSMLFRAAHAFAVDRVILRILISWKPPPNS
jgi:integrase